MYRAFVENALLILTRSRNDTDHRRETIFVSGLHDGSASSTALPPEEGSRGRWRTLYRWSAQSGG